MNSRFARFLASFVLAGLWPSAMLEASTIGFSQTQYTVDEGGGNAVLTVTVDRTADPDFGSVVTVNYQTIPGTATAGTDYTNQQGTLTFAIGVSSIQITVAILQDTIAEGAETFDVILFSPTNSRGFTTSLRDRSATVTIFDDDGTTVQFNPTTYSVSEATGAVTLTVSATRFGNPNAILSVSYATRNGTATAPQDYTAASGTITFNAGETQKQITVGIVQDGLIENPENFFVDLSNPVNAGLKPNQSTATVNIADTDSGTSTIQFSSASYSLNEASGSVSLTVIRSGGLGLNVSVRYQTIEGTAIANSDYSLQSGTLSFVSGETQKTIVIGVLNDSVVESNETFGVTLFGPSGNAVLGSPSTATVSIIDDDPTPAQDNSTKILNVSTRGPVQSDDEVMIAGFIIRGEAQKQVVLRGIGPSLTALGVVGAINDPSLTLFDENGTQLAFNDDYGSNSQADRETLTAVGLTPLDAREAAVVASLSPANYTLILRGTTNGIGLVEAYDIARTAASRFANISTRGKVEQGDNGAMIAGFIIGAPPEQPGASRRVVIRAKGPSLTSAGIRDALADTSLDLYRGSQLILSNDNWKSNSSADQQELRSYDLAPQNDKEAALVTSLDPGSYSAVVRGKNNTTGVALAEVYQVNQ